MDILRDPTYEKIEFSLCDTIMIFFYNLFCGCFYETECFKKCCILTDR